ncbi:hypothetical protein SAMN04515666_103613 [Bosea lupini]|uniref:Uncharacterized protein n=1 Tax=Bosea lupini TaxID=1036779 RepID=A0A1H7PU30_9HYPH|nr:hypothetical protein [Bosea lupini]SEL39401.1 hypothetical protein SAMN04515666_103613 [Bosea lupini]
MPHYGPDLRPQIEGRYFAAFGEDCRKDPEMSRLIRDAAEAQAAYSECDEPRERARLLRAAFDACSAVAAANPERAALILGFGHGFAGIVSRTSATGADHG